MTDIETKIKNSKKTSDEKKYSNANHPEFPGWEHIKKYDGLVEELTKHFPEIWQDIGKALEANANSLPIIEGKKVLFQDYNFISTVKDQYAALALLHFITNRADKAYIIEKKDAFVQTEEYDKINDQYYDKVYSADFDDSKIKFENKESNFKPAKTYFCERSERFSKFTESARLERIKISSMEHKNGKLNGPDGCWNCFNDTHRYSSCRLPLRKNFCRKCGLQDAHSNEHPHY